MIAITPDVYGTISDSVLKIPLKGVNVFIQLSSYSITVKTSSDGTYYFFLWSGGSANVTINHPHYISQTYSVAYSPTPQRKNISLVYSGFATLQGKISIKIKSEQDANSYLLVPTENSQVSLYNLQGKLISRVLSQAGGEYIISDVFPNNYKLRATYIDSVGIKYAKSAQIDVFSTGETIIKDMELERTS